MGAGSGWVSPAEHIDIVLTTRNRLDYLRETLHHIYQRTRIPYRLHVVDDASDEGNVEYLLGEFDAGRVHDLLLRRDHCGAMANLNAGAWLSFSDPVVFTDDDVLCPDVQPDWLTRGVTEMRRRHKLAMLALHHPGAKHKVRKEDEDVAYCASVGGTFCFIRRRFLMEHPLPHERGNLSRPMERRCELAREHGWDVGFLRNVYCCHIGHYSELTGEEYAGRFIHPVDLKTFEPAQRGKR
jgi:hypothetical protein